jgi:multidrug efflux system membrane fusion protein
MREHGNQPRHLKRIAAAVAIVAAVCAGAVWFSLRGQADAGPPAGRPPPVPVAVGTTSRADVPVYLTGLGTVEAYNSVTVRTQVDGQLQEVLFKEGQDVRRGDVLATVDPRTFQAALDQAQAKLRQDQASLQNDQLILGRDAQLAKSNFTSQETVDNQKSLVAQLGAQIAQDQAMISTAQTELSYTRIVSPIDGRAGLRLVDAGNIVHTTDATGLVVINQVHPIAVISTLPEGDFQAVRRALAEGPVEAAALSRDDGSVLDIGTVTLIDNAIDPTSGTIRLKSTFPNKVDRLWPGQFVDLRVRVATLHDAVIVPSGALQRGPDGFFVYSVRRGDTVEPVAVTPGQISNGTAVITKGLDPGQQVVVEGQYRLSPGARITTAAPMAAGAG